MWYVTSSEIGLALGMEGSSHPAPGIVNTYNQSFLDDFRE